MAEWYRFSAPMYRPKISDSDLGDRAVNLDSIFLCCKAVLPEMIRRHRGRIIMFSSPTGKQPLPHRAPYATTKMAVIGLTRTLAAEVGRHNITVNAICPGGHPARDLELAKAFAEYRGLPFDGTTYTNYAPGPKPANKVLAGRWLQAEGYVQDPGIPEDAAAMAVFIASDEAASFTGQDVNTAAGFVMW